MFDAGAGVAGAGAFSQADSIDSGVNWIGVFSYSGASLIKTLSSIRLPWNSWSCGVMVNLDILGEVLSKLGEGRWEEDVPCG